MSENHGGGSKILVLSEDEAFGSDIVSAVEETDTWVRAEYIDTPTSVFTKEKNDDISGVVVDCKISEPTTVVSRLTSELGLPVIGLADSSGHGESIAGLLEAGAIDIFPRTTETTLYELVVEKIRTEASDQPTKRNVDVGEYPYQKLFQHAPSGLVVHDSNTGEILDINERFSEIVEYDSNELVGEDIGFLTAPEEDTTSAEVNPGWERGPQCHEMRYQRRNGELFVVKMYSTKFDIGGRELTLSSVHEITESRRIERRFREILERIDEAIYFLRAEELTNPSLHPDDFYSGYEDIWGHSLEDIFNRYEDGFFGTLHPEERSSFRSFVAEIGQDIESGTVSNSYVREYRIERADGEHRWIRSDFYPTEWETGPLRMLIVSRDITERKQREREYEQIFNGVQDAIVVHDPESGDMTDVNEAFCELVGYDRDQILKLGTAGVSVEKEGYTQDHAEEIIADVMETGEVGPIEWIVETKAGEHRLMEVVATTAQIGSEVRHLSIQRDITERKRREQRLDVFNRILRHNLRNQLDVIRSHAEVLADQTGSKHPERIIATVDKLAEIGARARKIDRVMSMDETLVVINLSEELCETVEEVQSRPSAVTVTTKLPEKALLQTNKAVLRLAVESAVENATDYAESAVRIAVEESPTGFVINISDDGSGIPAEELTPIEARTETNHQHGSGLGLWQLRWSVDKLNGELSFDTSEGTTVRIAIPDRRGSSHTG